MQGTNSARHVTHFSVGPGKVEYAARSEVDQCCMSANPKPSTKVKTAAAAPPDERAATIERLERALAEERQNSSALRASVEDLKFKLEVVEKSYLKQLSDARVKRDAAEQLVGDKEARLAALDAAMGETLQLLQKTHEQLERLAADHDRLCKELARRDGVFVKTASRTYGAAAPEDSIDDLLAAPSASRDRPGGGGHLQARVAAPVEQPAAEMIPADLVFTKSDDDEDDDQ